MKLLKLKRLEQSELYVFVEVTYKTFFDKEKIRKVTFNLEYTTLSTWTDNGNYIPDFLKENIKAFLLANIKEVNA